MAEVVEERREQGQPALQEGHLVAVERFSTFVRVWVCVMGAWWAASAAHLLSHWDALGGRTLHWGGWGLSMAGLMGGAALGVGISWFCLRNFRGRFTWYKPGQGRWVRFWALAAVGVVALFASGSFYLLPALDSIWWPPLWSTVVSGVGIQLRPVLFPAAGLFTALLLAAYLLMNRPKWADFLVETEGELKKVAWPPRKEYMGSAVVVVLVVVIVSGFLHLVDTGLSRILGRWLGIGF